MISFKLFKLVNLITFLFSLDYDTFSVARVDDLKLEYLTYPKGIDIRNPQFSWKVTSDEGGVYQGAFQILVGKSLDELIKKTRKTWDFGKVILNETSNIEYD